MRLLRGSERRPSRRVVRMLMRAAILSPALAGCGGPIGPPADGIGNVTVSGAVSVSGSGVAWQESGEARGASFFQLAIIPSSPGWQLRIEGFVSRPAIGTHDLVASDTGGLAATLFFRDSSGSSRSFHSTAGELKVTGSSPAVVQGSFTFTATEFQGSGTVQVEGSFVARCAPSTICR